VGQFQRGEVMPLDEVVLDGVLTGTDGWASQLCPTRGQGWPYILPQMPMSMSSGWRLYSTVHEVVLRPSQSKSTVGYMYYCQYKIFVSHRAKSSLTRVKTRR